MIAVVVAQITCTYRKLRCPMLCGKFKTSRAKLVFYDCHVAALHSTTKSSSLEQRKVALSQDLCICSISTAKVAAVQ